MNNNEKRPGYEHVHEIRADFHDRLAINWPEPREQLHMGGWAATHDLTAVLGLDTASHLLDLCCGEGGTAIWLAQSYQRQVTGIDIVTPAVIRARERAGNLSVQFVAGNVFYLPFPDETFDVIYGQDPDGLAHNERVHIFRECFRVLQSGGRIGFQHWLLQDGASPELVEAFNAINAELGFASMYNLEVSNYVQAMQAAGFSNIQVDDVSDIYRRHMERIEDLANQRESGSVDRWTALVLKIFRAGYKVGARIRADKP